MYGYVNHQAIRDLFTYIDKEADPQNRMNMLTKMRDEVSNNLVDQYSRTFYELKDTLGWTVGEIAEFSKTSERKVKALIRWHQRSHNVTDILDPSNTPKPDNVVDISSLVARKGLKTHDHQATAIPKTLEQVFLEETAVEEQANRS
ncbi:MAG: hypothetical protein ISQ78_04840 [Candidatus Actinomarina sp.]|nr:hypothetical protein [Candidatus Actinomarina sp.]